MVSLITEDREPWRQLVPPHRVRTELSPGSLRRFFGCGLSPPAWWLPRLNAPNPRPLWIKAWRQHFPVGLRQTMQCVAGKIGVAHTPHIGGAGGVSELTEGAPLYL